MDQGLTHRGQRARAGELQIELQRIDGRTHHLRISRADGSHEQVTCETRSLLLHDLVHFAVEAEAGISGGFWGLLAQGVPLARLNDRENPLPDPLLMQVEGVVGPLQAVVNGRLPAEHIISRAIALGDRIVDADFVAAVQARVRALRGRWRATGFHATLHLRWPPAPAKSLR